MVAGATFMPVLMLFLIIAEMDIAIAAMHDKTRTAATKGAAGLGRGRNVGTGMGRRGGEYSGKLTQRQIFPPRIRALRWLRRCAAATRKVEVSG